VLIRIYVFFFSHFLDIFRDLKPENILYSSPDDAALLKIADFGLATLLRPNQMMNVACGTPGYVAPEILRGVAYGREVDMWSIGVILYILLCGFPPFYDDNNKKLFALIINANYSFPDPYWTAISASGKDLVSKLLVVDPSKRLTAEQTLAHPWMSELNTTALPHFKDNLKSYNAKRRLRGAIRAVQLVGLLQTKKKGGQVPTSILDAVNAQDTAVRSRSIDNADILPAAIAAAKGSIETTASHDSGDVTVT
jgi:calcium/calmodulin-dependent protein kinase I